MNVAAYKKGKVHLRCHSQLRKESHCISHAKISTTKCKIGYTQKLIIPRPILLNALSQRTSCSKDTTKLPLLQGNLFKNSISATTTARFICPLLILRNNKKNFTIKIKIKTKTKEFKVSFFNKSLEQNSF